jgi:plastocyanin
MKKSIVLAVLCLALAVLVAACGDDDDDAGGNANTTEGRANVPAGKENVKTVDIKDIKFVPMELTVRAGNTIQWTNSDQVPHTVTKGTGPGQNFDSKKIDPGGTYERNFPDKGTINYVCTIHPNQKGTLVVR